MMLIYSSLLSAEEAVPSISFLEFLAQEENEPWMEPILETGEEKTDKADQADNRSLEEDSNETN